MEVLGRKEAVEQKENVAVGGGRCIVLSLGQYLCTGKCL